MDDALEELNGQIADLGLDGEFDETNIFDTSPNGLLATIFYTVEQEIITATSLLGIGTLSSSSSSSDFSFASLQTLCTHLHCPYTGKEFTNPIYLLTFLVSELQGLRIALSRAHKVAVTSAEINAGPSLDAQIHMLCRMLNIPMTTGSTSASSNGTAADVLTKALAKVKGKAEWLLGRLPKDFLNGPLSARLLNPSLATPELLKILTEINNALRDDYAIRRSMLMTRLDVTIQSFLWSHKAEGREGEITSSISARRKALTTSPAVIRSMDAFEAGGYLAEWYHQRVTDASSRGLRSSAVKSVRIGAVPDRGGRVDEMKLSARDLMPEWQIRRSDSNGSSGGRSGGSGGQQRSKEYGKQHNDRAKELLRDARKHEGEAGAALEELEAEEADGMNDQDNETTNRNNNNKNNHNGGGGGGGGGKKYWHNKRK